MGTVSEDQAQEHNEEKNRPGGENLEAGGTSEENAAREGPRGRLRDREGRWTCPQAGCTRPGPEAQPALGCDGWEPRQPPSPAGADARPAVEPAGGSRSRFVNPWCWFLLSLLCPPPHPSPAWQQHRDVSRQGGGGMVASSHPPPGPRVLDLLT